MQMNQDEKEALQDSSPTLSATIERYVRTIISLRLKAARERSTQDRIADAITDLSGNPRFVYIHMAWFAVWLLLNTGHLGLRPFDPFPYGLLTMIVSLEAIFLSTFVLITQNRMSQQAEHRADLDLHIDLLAEYELTRVLQMLDAIQDKMGIENEQDVELTELERETKPEEVLAEIERLQRRVLRPTRPPQRPKTRSASA
jgi:uncharacterized membrane protein